MLHDHVYNIPGTWWLHRFLLQWSVLQHWLQLLTSFWTSRPTTVCIGVNVVIETGQVFKIQNNIRTIFKTYKNSKLILFIFFLIFIITHLNSFADRWVSTNIALLCFYIINYLSRVMLFRKRYRIEIIDKNKIERKYTKQIQHNLNKSVTNKYKMLILYLLIRTSKIIQDVWTLASDIGKAVLVYEIKRSIFS